MNHISAVCISGKQSHLVFVILTGVEDHPFAIQRLANMDIEPGVVFFVYQLGTCARGLVINRIGAMVFINLDIDITGIVRAPLETADISGQFGAVFATFQVADPACGENSDPLVSTLQASLR